MDPKNRVLGGGHAKIPSREGAILGVFPVSLSIGNIQSALILSVLFGRLQWQRGLLHVVMCYSCPEYYDLISEPVDFVTIKRNIDSGRYSGAAAFDADCQRCFTNVEVAASLALMTSFSLHAPCRLGGLMCP